MCVGPNVPTGAQRESEAQREPDTAEPEKQRKPGESDAD